MTDLTVERNLVKSPPELWTELSEIETLARHLGELGEIRITKREPEHTVAWEGEHARGVVEIAASGWGTKVTLTAELEATTDPAEPDRDVSAGTDEAPSATPQAQVSPATPDAEPETKTETDLELSDEAALELDYEDDVPYFTPPQRRRGRLARWWQRRADGRRALDPAPAGDDRPTAFEPIAEASPAESEALGEDAPGPAVDEPAEAAQPETGAAAADPTAAAAAAAAAAASVDTERVRAVLETTLDNLGQAHHRPFSRG